MLAQFTKQPSSVMRNHSELLSNKHTLLTQYSAQLSHTLSLTSLRIQIIHHVNDVQHLLNPFPAVKSSFFTLGKPKDPLAAIGAGGTTSSNRKLVFERIQEMGGVNDPRQIKARPSLLLDKEGGKLMNLWYLPHFTEVRVGLYMERILCKK